jgi:hypothetical protein
MKKADHRLQVLAGAIDIRDPLALFAAVVAIEHRRHRVDPIDMNNPTVALPCGPSAATGLECTANANARTDSASSCQDAALARQSPRTPVSFSVIRATRRAMPASGTPIQVGRLATS